MCLTSGCTEVTNMIEFKIIRLDTGGFIVKNAFFDNVFASTRIDDALVYVRDKMTVNPLKVRHDIETRAASDIHMSYNPDSNLARG
jgi:hypothetical protein